MMLARWEMLLNKSQGTLPSYDMKVGPDGQLQKTNVKAGRPPNPKALEQFQTIQRAQTNEAMAVAFARTGLGDRGKNAAAGHHQDMRAPLGMNIEDRRFLLHRSSAAYKRPALFSDNITPQKMDETLKINDAIARHLGKDK